MSTAAPQEARLADGERETVLGAARAYVDKVRAGDVG